MIRMTLGLLAALALLLAAPAAMAAEGDYNCDYNNDGVVDDADRAILIDAMGTRAGEPGFLEAADHNGDGLITAADLGIFLEVTQ